MNSNPPTDQTFTASHQTSAELVSRRAYEIWEQDGRPEGRDLQHWLQAEHELASPSQKEPASASTKNDVPRYDELGSGKMTDTRPLQTQQAARPTTPAKRSSSAMNAPGRSSTTSALPGSSSTTRAR